MDIVNARELCTLSLEKENQVEEVECRIVTTKY